jgi:ubiquinone/menaquinone biosynthesis C-methylase UbiE
LACARGHEFVVDESSAVPTLFDLDYGAPFHSESWDPLGRSPGDYEDLGPTDVDPFVQNQISATGGALYLKSTLRRYPKPWFPLAPPSTTASVIDVGAGWGRWSIAAASRGWAVVVAVDPWLDNCRAHARVAKQLGFGDAIDIVNGDGRRLPLPDDSVDAAFSYSVLQHLPKVEARAAFEEMVRVVRPGGEVRVQMPNVAGARQRQLLRRGVVSDSKFNVRPWSFDELGALASDLCAQWSISADGYFSLNAQWSERAAMPMRSKLIVAVSESLRRLSTVATPLVRVADSLWVSLRVDS